MKSLFVALFAFGMLFASLIGGIGTFVAREQGPPGLTFTKRPLMITALLAATAVGLALVVTARSSASAALLVAAGAVAYMLWTYALMGLRLLGRALAKTFFAAPHFKNSRLRAC